MENARFKDLCRLCLEVTGTHNIFKNDNDGLIQDIFQCTGILQISCHVKLPETICAGCMYRIKVAMDLREYATTNDLFMRSFLDDEKNNPYKIEHPTIPFRPVEDTVVDSRSGGCGFESYHRLELPVKPSSSLEPKHVKKHKSSKPTKQEQSPTKTDRPKISVRSLEDINSEKSVSSSSKSDPTSSKRQKRSSSVSRRKSSSQNNTSVDTKLEVKKEHTCDICKKIYATPKKLYLHKRSHSKKIYCPLDVCGKRFVSKGDLQKHIRSHTGEKPYRCNLCDKSFTQNVTLKAHKVTHQAKMEIMT